MFSVLSVVIIVISITFRVDLDFMNDISELEAIQLDYHDGKTLNGNMSEGWCRNGGKCVPEVIRGDKGLSVISKAKIVQLITFQ